MLTVIKNPAEVRARTGFLHRSDSFRVNRFINSAKLIFVLLLSLRLYNFEFVFTVVKSTMPSYEKLQCRLSAPYILVACDGGLQRKKINTDDHLSMCSCSGGTELTKQPSSGSVDLHGAHFRGGNKYAGTYTAKMSTVVLIFADGAQIRCAPVHVYAGGNEYAVT